MQQKASESCKIPKNEKDMIECPKFGHPLMGLAHLILARCLAFHRVQLALGWAADQDILLLEFGVGILGDGHIQAHGCSHELHHVQDLNA